MFVVDGSNKAAYRSVKVGKSLGNGLCVVEEGLKEGEQVVLDGVQKVRSGDTVAPKPAEALSADAAKRPAAKPAEAAMADAPGPPARSQSPSTAKPEPTPGAVPPSATKAEAAVSNRPSS